MKTKINNPSLTQASTEQLNQLGHSIGIQQRDNHATENSPLVKYINQIMLDAIQSNASDLHFEPYEHEYRVRYRIDGLLRHIVSPPFHLMHQMTSRLKVMAQMDISEKRIPQDGRIKFQISNSKAIDCRVSSLPTIFGEKIVLRILDTSATTYSIDMLGLEHDQKELLLNALAKPQGMLLLTGPTGSGKTMTLYSALNMLNTEHINISTIEDPIEIYLSGVNQVNVNQKIGLNFSSALRAFLRQDPDVIMVGEIRDLETAEIAIQASQTGHRVLSTLHTNSALETLIRLKQMGVATFNIVNAIDLVIAQRLLRKLCPHCKIAFEISKTDLLSLGLLEDDFKQYPADQSIFTIYTASVCHACYEGFYGRTGVYEVIHITPELSHIMTETGQVTTLAKKAAELGFYSLYRAGLKKILQGITSIEEVDRICPREFSQ